MTTRRTRRGKFTAIIIHYVDTVRPGNGEGGYVVGYEEWDENRQRGSFLVAFRVTTETYVCARIDGS